MKRLFAKTIATLALSLLGGTVLAQPPVQVQTQPSQPVRISRFIVLI